MVLPGNTTPYRQSKNQHYGNIKGSRCFSWNMVSKDILNPHFEVPDGKDHNAELLAQAEKICAQRNVRLTPQAWKCCA